MLDRQFRFAIKLAVAFAAVWGLILLFNRIFWVINLVVVSFLIVYSISPAVDYLARIKRLPRLAAVSFVYTCFLLLLVLLINLIIPIVISEIRNLAHFLPRYSTYLTPYIQDAVESISRPDITNTVINFLQQVPRHLQQILNRATIITVAVISRLGEVAIVLFMVFYLLRDLEAIKQSAVTYLPRSWRKEAIYVLGVIDEKVGAYLRGNLLRCTLVGILTGFGLSFLGMPFALMLGVLAGVLNIIVYIGPYIAAAPAVLIALSISPAVTIFVILLYIIVQSLDGFVITPLLLGKAVDLHPFSVIIAVLVGGRLFGFLGILLGIPVAATLKVLYKYYRQEI
ncbi:MAG: AI-2E family transporter [bacterium]